MSVDFRQTLGPAYIYGSAKPAVQSPKNKSFTELLREHCQEFPPSAFPLKGYEAKKLWDLHRSRPIEGSPTTLLTFTNNLIKRLQEETKITFHLYLRGSAARDIVNLEDQFDTMILQINNRELIEAWYEQRKQIKKSPPPRDTDLLLYTQAHLEMNDLISVQKIIREVIFESFGILCEPLIPRKNPLNETEEPLTITKISGSLDLVVGTMKEIYNLFSMDAPAILIDTRQLFALTSFGDNLWMGAYDSLFRRIQIKKRHESDFHAFLTAVQHQTNGSTIIESETSLEKIAAKFDAKIDVTIELLVNSVRNRTLNHFVDPFSYLFNVCIYMPEGPASKREDLWKVLRREFQTMLKIENASFQHTASELFYLRKIYPEHPLLKQLQLVFPIHFQPLSEEFSDLNLRKRLEIQFFYRGLNEPMPIFLEPNNPYEPLANAILKLPHGNKNTTAFGVILNKTLEWLPVLSRDQFQKQLQLLSLWTALPPDTNQDNLCEKLFKSSFFQIALSSWKAAHSGMDQEKQFFYLYPHFEKRPKVLLQLFKELKQPSALLLLKILHSHIKELQPLIPEKLAGLLTCSAYEDRLDILRQFPQTYWPSLLLDQLLFKKEDAAPLLQDIMNQSPSYAFLWKCEASSITLRWPSSVNKEKLIAQIPQKTLKQRLLFLRDNMRMEEFDAFYPYLKDKSSIPKNTPKLEPNLERYRQLRSQFVSFESMKELEEALFALEPHQIIQELMKEIRLVESPFHQYSIRALQEANIKMEQRQALFLRLIQETAKPVEKIRLYMRLNCAIDPSPKIEASIPIEINLLDQPEKARFVQILAERGSVAKAAHLLLELQWEIKQHAGEETLQIIWNNIQKMEDTKQLEPLQTLSYIQNGNLKETLLKVLQDYLKDKPPERIIFSLRNISLETREQLLFIPNLLPEQERLHLLLELFEKNPKEAIYWELEEKGGLLRPIKSKNLIKLSQPSLAQLNRRLLFLFDNDRLQECMELALEHQGKDSPYLDLCIKKAMTSNFILCLPKLLQKPSGLDAFLEIVSNDWMGSIFHEQIDHAALEALFKVLKLTAFQEKFPAHLTQYFQLFLNHPSSQSLKIDLIAEALKLKQVDLMLPQVLQLLKNTFSPMLKTIIEQEKERLFCLCEDSPELLYDLLSVFRVQDIHIHNTLPDTFIDYLIKKLHLSAASAEEGHFTAALTLKCLENSQISFTRLSLLLLNQILRLENKELFKRWIPFCNGVIHANVEIPIEWMIELVYANKDQDNHLLKRCLTHSKLTLEEWKKLFPHIESKGFLDIELLRDNLLRFPAEITKVTSYLIHQKDAGALNEEGEAFLTNLLCNLISARQIHLFQDKPHLFLNTGQLAEEAMALCLPSLLNDCNFQAAQKWRKLHPKIKLESDTIVLWLSQRFKAKKLCDFSEYDHLFNLISENSPAILSSRLLPETLLLFIKEHHKEPLPLDLQIHLCSLVKHFLYEGKVEDPIQVEFFYFLFSTNQIIEMDKCISLVCRLAKPSHAFIFKILEYNACHCPDNAMSIAETLQKDLSMHNENLIEQELVLLIQELLLANIQISEGKIETVESTLELINLVNGKNISQNNLYLKGLLERTAVNALYMLFKLKRATFVNHLYLYLASKAFPPHSLELGGLSSGVTTNKGRFFAFISGVIQPPPEIFHAELNSILCQLFQGFFNKHHHDELLSLSIMCEEILLDFLPIGKPLHCYEKAIETILRSIYTHPAAKIETMECLIPLFNQLVKRKKYLQNPRLLIKLEIWLLGTCQTSVQKLIYWEPQLMDQIPKIILSFIEKECAGDTHLQRAYLLRTLLYTLKYIELNDSQTIELYRHFIQHLKKGWQEYHQGIASLINKTFDEIKIKQELKIKILKLVN